MLLVEAPFIVSQQDVLESNTLEDLAEEYGVPFLNMSFILENTGLNCETDFCDESHVNILGAEKYTSFLASYLSENYDLPDHRREEMFSSWDVEWSEFQEEQSLLREQLARDVNGLND